mgnify:CR=1 FL=1
MAWLDSLSPQTQFVFFTLLKIACVLGPLLTLVAYAVLAERKLSALIQDRVGPNRVNLPLIGSIPVIGPFLTKLGFWHPLVDGVKSFIKEDFTPAHVRKIYFWLAPAIALPRHLESECRQPVHRRARPERQQQQERRVARSTALTHRARFGPVPTESDLVARTAPPQ